MDGEFGAGRCKLLHLEDKQQGPTYSTGNCIQSSDRAIREKNIKKECMCVYN